ALARPASTRSAVSRHHASKSVVRVAATFLALLVIAVVAERLEEVGLEHADLLLDRGEALAATAHQLRAPAIGGEGLLEAQGAGLHPLDDGLELGDCRLEADGLGRGFGGATRRRGLGGFAGHVSGSTVAAAAAFSLGPHGMA